MQQLKTSCSFIPQTLQHSIFQSLPKTPHIGVRGFAKPMRSPAAAPCARPSTPLRSQSSAHRIPSPEAVEAPPHLDGGSESPSRGQATVQHSNSERTLNAANNGSADHGARGSNRCRETASRASADVLGSQHAHSILHSRLLCGQLPEHLPPPSQVVQSDSVRGAEMLRSSSPFQGFTKPSMSSNELQVPHLYSCRWLSSPCHIMPLLYKQFRLSQGLQSAVSGADEGVSCPLGVDDG
jgi:hypothetical protein